MVILQTFLKLMAQSVKVTEYESTDEFFKYEMPAPSDNELCVIVSANMYKCDTVLQYIIERVREAILACEDVEGLGMVVSLKENDSSTFEDIKRQINDQRANPLVAIRPKEGVFYRCAVMSDWCKFDGQTYKFSELVAVFSTIDSLLAGIPLKEVEDNEVVLKVNVINPNSLLVTTEHGTIHCTSKKFSQFSEIKLQRMSNNE